MENIYKLYFDGASRGNPGLGGCGISIECKNKEIGVDYKYLGTCTNNIAEYSALELGLKKAIDLNIKNVIVFGDSLLVINQVNKLWKCNNVNLKKILNNIHHLKLNFTNIKFVHIKREKNLRADYLANKSIDNYFN